MIMNDRDSKTVPSNHIEQNAIANVRTNEDVVDPAKLKATGYMMFFCAWISFSAWIANFDNGYSGIVLIMPSFIKAFGHCHMGPNPLAGGKVMMMCHLSALEQSLISVSSIFMALGAILAGVTGHYFGRRGTIQFACALLIIGAAGMLGTKGSYLSYMVCKCISGAGIGQLMASSIVYGTECCVASKRGLMMGLYNVGLALGNVSAAAVCAGSGLGLKITNDWQWKTPIICQIPLGLLLGIGVMMFPESPRWLLTKGREESARRSFGKFYRLDPYSPEITAQVAHVQTYIKLEKVQGATSSWTEIYHKNDIRRTLVSVMILVGLAITGIQFVAPYAALFLSQSGIKNPYLINVIIGLCIFAGAFPGPFILEYGGRRFAMLVGYSLMALCMLVFSAVSTGLGATNPIAKNVLVAFLCIWAFVFGGCIGSSVWLGSAEMHSVRLRTYGQANTTFFYQVFGFAASFWSPYMLSKDYGNMGTNVGYFYFGVTAVVLMFTYLFVPETARLTLEQIDDYFTSGRRAWSTSTRRNKLIANGNTYDISPEAHERMIHNMEEKTGHHVGAM